MHTRLQAPNLNALWAEIFVEEAIRLGIDYFCISPGSRSTPLTVAVARHPKARLQICYDERAAAFHALGFARATGIPALLICTSGTAVANYLPAVVEASVDHVPLLICSADRPPELEQSGANQAIPQTHLFGHHVRWFFELPCPTSAIPAPFVLTTLAQAFHRATGSFAGPVHLNWRFREPLAPIASSIPPEYTASLDRWCRSSQPWTTYAHAQAQGIPALPPFLFASVARAKRGVLVLGRMPIWWDKSPILRLAEHLGWPIFADIGSGLRLGKRPTHRILSFDGLLRDPRWRTDTKPDVILHLGGPLVSKHFLSYLQEHPDTPYVVVQEHSERLDPIHQVHHRLACHPSAFAETLHTLLPADLSTLSAEWIALWKAADQQHLQQTHTALALDDLHEPAVAFDLSRLIPKDHALFVGNSMPIRDLDRFADVTGHPVPVAANRGASGIDGLLASALGFVMGSGTAGTLLIGDLSLIHDLNSLILLKQSQIPLVVVVLNNHGGGIFQYLPIARFEDVFSRCFTTPHDISLAPIAQSIGVFAVQVTSRAAFRQAYTEATRTNQPALIEVCTHQEQNLAFSRALSSHTPTSTR